MTSIKGVPFFKRHFKNQKDLLTFIGAEFKTIEDKNLIEAILISFSMAAKNSILYQRGRNAAEEYFQICLNEFDLKKEDYDWVQDVIVNGDHCPEIYQDKTYENVFGRMLHNYTILRGGLTLSIFNLPGDYEDKNEWMIVNEYDKLGSNKTTTRISYILVKTI